MREKDSRNLKKKKQSVHSRRDKLIQNETIILSERKISAELRGIYIEITEKWRGRKMSTQAEPGLCCARHIGCSPALALSSGLRIPFFILMNTEESSPQKDDISKKFSLYSHLTVLPFG